MKGYLALIRINLKLALRERAVLVFNYLFPLIFFFIFSQFMGGNTGGMSRIVPMVLTLGILGSGLFGAGMRAVAEREANILRRYRVAPITPFPILVSSMVTGWILYMPSVLLILGLAHFKYNMAFPPNFVSLLVLVSVGAFSMRAIGSIIASVVNSVAESNILIQMLYMPMLFLSGATFPVSALPNWAQILSQYLPASHLFTGMQSIMLRNETIAQNLVPVTALLATMTVATFISVKLFRWEKGEIIAPKAKLWLIAVLFPFILVGTYQAYSKENIAKGKIFERDMRRGRSRLIHDARIFIGDGKVIESGGVLIRNGKIAAIYEGASPDAKSIDADPVEGSGKTLLPGLIDVHVHIGSQGGIPENPAAYNPRKVADRALASYLFSGVTAIKSAGDFLNNVLEARSRIQSEEKLGAELFATGPLFTTDGGHGTEFFKDSPEFLQKMASDQFTRTPKSAAEARMQVAQLKQRGVDGIKAVLDGGVSGMLFNRMDPAILKAIAEAAKAANLPLVVHTGDARDVADAIAAGANGIEHGSMRDRIPDETFADMARRGVYYDPTLSVAEAFNQFVQGKSDLLDRTLVAQTAPPKLIQNTRKMLTSPQMQKQRERMKAYPADMDIAGDNLVRAAKAGVRIVTGSDAGNMLVLHGPTIHRELQLWVKAGVPAKEALQGATSSAAGLLGSDKRFGFIRQGYDASMILVDGNPLKDISITERISAVFYKGEWVVRSELFDDEK